MKQYKVEFLKTSEVLDGYGAAKIAYGKARKTLQSMETNGNVRMYIRDFDEKKVVTTKWAILQELIINEYGGKKIKSHE